eukprot:6211763-Pleurochrysis_carterae.AAC.1
MAAGTACPPAALPRAECSAWCATQTCHLLTEKLQLTDQPPSTVDWKDVYNKIAHIFTVPRILASLLASIILSSAILCETKGKLHLSRSAGKSQAASNRTHATEPAKAISICLCVNEVQRLNERGVAYLQDVQLKQETGCAIASGEPND